MGNRPIESIGRKWNDAYVSSLDDAEAAYVDKVVEAGENLSKPDTTGMMGDAYTAAVTSDAFRANVRNAFSPEVAGVAYSQRAAQIRETGTTLFQQQKMVDMTRIRRGVASEMANLIALIDAGDDVIAFKFAYSTPLKRTIANKAAMAVADRLTIPVTATKIFNQIKTVYANNKAKAPWLDFKDVVE